MNNITFDFKWSPRMKCYIEVKIGSKLFATSIKAYDNAEEAHSATTHALEELRKGNEQPFKQTFTKN